MFLKRNQGFGQTYRKKKETNNKNKTKKSHTSKDLCTGINNGLREIKDSGCTANLTSAVPYFSDNLVKLGWVELKDMSECLKTKPKALPFHHIRTLHTHPFD